MGNKEVAIFVKSVKTKELRKIKVASRGTRALDTSSASAAPSGYLIAGIQFNEDLKRACLGMEEKEVVMDEYTLPPDQREVIDLVKKVAEQHNYSVEIIDVAKENMIHGLIYDIEEIDTIPTIKTNLGNKLEGAQIIKEKLELLLLSETQQH
jgi:hypothetical protein